MQSIEWFLVLLGLEVACSFCLILSYYSCCLNGKYLDLICTLQGIQLCTLLTILDGFQVHVFGGDFIGSLQDYELYMKKEGPMDS